MTPAYAIMVGGSNIQGRVVSVEVTDSEGNESDKCVIEVDDRNCEVVLPAKETILTVALGYRETGLSPMGVFKVSEVETSGHPRRITINATAADFSGKLKEQRDDGYEDETVGGIIGKVASRHGLAPQVSASLASKQHKYVAQTAQSDMVFASDLARQHGANMKISNGRMILARVGEIIGGIVTVRGELAGGSDVVDYNAKAMARPEYAQSVCAWWDRENVEQKKEQKSAGKGKAKLQQPHHYPNQQEAADAAEGKGEEKASEEAGGSISIVGRSGIRAMMGLMIIGVRPGSADGLWVIKTATHKIDDGGYVTQIEYGLPGKSGQQGG